MVGERRVGGRRFATGTGTSLITGDTGSGVGVGEEDDSCFRVLSLIISYLNDDRT